MRSIGRPRLVDRPATLFRAGESSKGLHAILSGGVRVLRLAPSGRSVVVHREGAGGILGELPLFDGGPYPATAEVTEPTRVVLLPRAALLRSVAEDAALAAFFHQRLASRLREVIGRLDAMATRSVAHRLARHLWARRSARATAVISLGMRQEDLAEELGTTREVIVRELRRLCTTGVLKALGAGRYETIDIDRLRELAR